MKKSIFLFGFVAIAALSQAQTQEVPTYYNPLLTGVPSLAINPDAVSGGMGDIGVSTKPDINSQYWNSSKYAMAEGPGGFAISYTPWLRKIVSDIDLAQIAGFYKISDIAGTVSASLRYFSLGEVTLKSSQNDFGMVVKPHELAFDVGYSRKLAEHFSMGVNMRFISSDLSAKTDPEYTPGFGFAADINGFYQQPIELSAGTSHLNVGFNISNIGTKISYDGGNHSNFIPTTLRLGGSYYIPFDQYNRLSVSAEVSKLLVPSRKSKRTENFDAANQDTWTMTEEQYSSISVPKGIFMSFADAPGGFKEEMQEIIWALGAEYSYNEQFFARTGFSHENEVKGNRKFFTFGAGFKWTAFRIDVGYVLALAKQSPIDGILRFTLSFDADGLKDLVK
jgi:hypothetical protein